MKHFLTWMIFIFSITGTMQGYAQKLIIRMNSGNEAEEQLGSLQKLYFSGGQLIVDFKSGSDESYLLSDIRKIYFDPVVSVEENTEESKLLVYPNPATERIIVHGIPAGEKVLRIFSIDGRQLVRKVTSTVDESIDISSFPCGLYLVNIDGFTSKFIKK